MTGKHYTPAEHATIKRLGAKGQGATAIAKHLPGRTPGGVQAQLVKLGYVDPKRCARAKGRKERAMPPAAHRAFCSFLRDYVDITPPPELARLWNRHASANKLPQVTLDQVHYWLEKMKLKFSPEQAAKNRAYENARKQRYRTAAKTSRTNFEKRAEERRKAFRTRKAEVLAAAPDTPLKTCGCCKEEWPLTKEFFRYKQDTRNKRWYFEAKGCILCVNAIRRRASALRAEGAEADDIRALLKQAERRRRDAAAEANLAAARTKRDALFKRKKPGPRRTCIDCREEWPLTEEFFAPSKLGQRSRFCRFCDNRYKREVDRAVADRRPVAPLRARRKELLAAARAEDRAAHRATLRTRAQELLGRRRPSKSMQCTCCSESWPLTEEFWLFEPADGPRAGKLARRYCRCCSHDKDAARHSH